MLHVCKGKTAVILNRLTAVINVETYSEGLCQDYEIVKFQEQNKFDDTAGDLELDYDYIAPFVAPLPKCEECYHNTLCIDMMQDNSPTDITIADLDRSECWAFDDVRLLALVERVCDWCTDPKAA